jgi:hypothetical protein
MKSKPVKGSARTKRFDVGGTVGALAGLGTLAYLLSRKKKDAATGNEGSGESTAKPVIKSMMDTEDDAAKQRAMAASKGRPEMGDATNDDITTKKTTTPVVKKTTPSVKATAPAVKATSTSKQGSVSTTGLDAGIAAGNKAKPNEERPSKPYPEKEAAAKKAADKAAAIKKATTAKGRSANPIAGTFESSGKSMARTPAQTMSERAREVQRRREEEMKSRYKKGGNVKKYADGGMTSSKPEPKKAPMPAFAREAKENRERDQKVKKEQDTYQKGEKTRLKEQGSMFKSGGMTASKRADGIAMRGKTRGKMY